MSLEIAKDHHEYACEHAQRTLDPGSARKISGALRWVLPLLAVAWRWDSR